MSGGLTERNQVKAAERDARLARYAELRDAGMRRTDIQRELGVSPATIDNYSRWYRRTHGLPSGSNRTTSYDRDKSFWPGEP